MGYSLSHFSPHLHTKVLYYRRNNSGEIIDTGGVYILNRGSAETDPTLRELVVGLRDAAGAFAAGRERSLALLRSTTLSSPLQMPSCSGMEVLRGHMARSVLVRCLESPLREGYNDVGANGAPLYTPALILNGLYPRRVYAR